jgi:hypothetical protein
MPSAKASEAATAAPSRIANPPTRGYACEASMAGKALLKRSYVRYRGQPGNHLLVLVLPVLTLSGPQDRCDGDLILWNWSQSH